MIGKGRNRAVAKTYWDASWNETTSPGTYAGYKTASGRAMRWGTNTVSAVNQETDSFCTPAEVGDPICRPTKIFKLTFEAGLPTSHEARSNSGDSGGGVFRKNSWGAWELAGIMIGINAYAGQPM